MTEGETPVALHTHGNKRMTVDEIRWRAESDLDAFRRVMEVRKDKGRMTAVRKVHSEQKEALEAVDMG